MAIVKEGYIGETHVLIDDSAYKGQTEEERNKIINEVYAFARRRQFEQWRAEQRKKCSAGSNNQRSD